MPNLQRSCQACIRSKRRCDRGVPGCNRCAEKSIECQYTNTPIAVGKGLRRDNQKEGLETPVFPEQLDRAFGPDIIRTFSADSLQQLKARLLSFSRYYERYGSAAFIHPNLATAYEETSPLEEVRGLLSERCGSQHRHIFSSLLHRSTHSTSYMTLLALAQSALILAIPSLLAPSQTRPTIQPAALWALTHRLWEEAPSSLPGLSPWTAWLVAESARRTILMCNILIRVHMVSEKGFAVQSLCIEALPFDVRDGLWECRTQASWKRLVTSSGRESLLSAAEFVKFQRQGTPLSPFKELVLLAFGDATAG